MGPNEPIWDDIALNGAHIILYEFSSKLRQTRADSRILDQAREKFEETRETSRTLATQLETQLEKTRDGSRNLDKNRKQTQIWKQ